MRICLLPKPPKESAIGGVMQAIKNLSIALTELGHTVVDHPTESDVVHGHAFDGCADVYTSHGIYPVGHREDFNNPVLFENISTASVVTAVSNWTARQFAFLGVKPRIINNGVMYDSLRKLQKKPRDYIIWAKNGNDIVNNPQPFIDLAISRPDLNFVMTVAPKNIRPPRNMRVIGIQPYEQMIDWLSGAMLLVSTGTENFPVQVLEAMALGVPVLALRGSGVDEVEGVVLTDKLEKELDATLDARTFLGRRGEQIVKERYDWRIIAKQYLEVYDEAIRSRSTRNGKVAVVIPCYNLADKVGRAVESVIKQTVKPDEIVVVDDGSSDNPSKALERYSKDIKIIRIPNSGVSQARNTGIMATKSEYVCCLDADDALSPDFIEKTKAALRSDYRIGIAFTGMRVVDSRHNEIADFPGESKPTFEELSKGNFIPCANLFRRKAWNQAGGYKNINPSWEDYELWLNIAELGWQLRHVPEARLIYTSTDTGRSGEERRGNHENLLRATVWGYHPRIYGNSAKVSFVIPCYNQWQYLWDAVESAWGQDYPHLEVIVVDDASTVSQSDIEGTRQRILSRFPDTRFISRKQNGGLSAARNTGIRAATGAWIVPLDADDKVAPAFVSECLKIVFGTQNYAYTDVYTWHNEGAGPMTKMEMPEFTPDRLLTNHQHACTILIKRSALMHSGLYDENMRDGWEDYEIVVRLVKQHHCGIRIPKPLFYYRWRENSMRQQAETKADKLRAYIWHKHDDIRNRGGFPMGCCGSSRPVHVMAGLSNDVNFDVPDGHYLVQYTGAKVGQMTKNGTQKRVYRYSAEERNFVVHPDDILLFGGASFRVIDSTKVKPKKSSQASGPVENFEIDPAEAVEFTPVGKKSDDLYKVAGVDDTIANRLAEAGIYSYQALLATGDEVLGAIFGTKKAARAASKSALALVKEQ